MNLKLKCQISKLVLSFQEKLSLVTSIAMLCLALDYAVCSVLSLTLTVSESERLLKILLLSVNSLEKT